MASPHIVYVMGQAHVCRVGVAMLHGKLVPCWVEVRTSAVVWTPDMPEPDLVVSALTVADQFSRTQT
jgi:hypothetical protein